MVGSTLGPILREQGHKLSVYDPYKDGVKDPKVLADADYIFVCVWTPMIKEQLDESSVLHSVAEIDKVATPKAIIIRSTILPGTMTALEEAYLDQHFIFAPEFLVEADRDRTARHADRLVIGASHWGLAEVDVAQILQDISPGSPIIKCELEEAVMIKLASNGILAAKVAIAHELAELCEQYGISWDNVRAGVGLDRRIAPDHLALNGEGGYGGACFPKDVQGIINAGDALDSPTKQAYIFKTIQATNAERRRLAQQGGEL